jgi:uncharacterized protein (DUF2384 family)
VARFREEEAHDPRAGQLPADAAARISTVVTLAAQCLGTPAAIRDFLIRDHILLGGRPIDVVMASSDGRDSVLKLLSNIYATHLPTATQER